MAVMDQGSYWPRVSSWSCIRPGFWIGIEVRKLKFVPVLGDLFDGSVLEISRIWKVWELCGEKSYSITRPLPRWLVRILEDFFFFLHIPPLVRWPLSTHFQVMQVQEWRQLKFWRWKPFVKSNCLHHKVVCLGFFSFLALIFMPCLCKRPRNVFSFFKTSAKSQREDLLTLLLSSDCSWCCGLSAW